MKQCQSVDRLTFYQAISICLLTLATRTVSGFEQEALAAKPGSATSSAGASSEPPAGRKLFYVTHSLMWDVPAPLTEEVAAFGIKDHTVVGTQRLGFSRTQQHWDLPDGKNQAKTALQEGKVDDFIMSPMDMPDKGVENFVMLGIQNNPSMRFFVQNNWAGFNNDGQKAFQSMQLMASGKLKKWDESTEEDLKSLNTECEKAFEVQVKEINEKLGREAVFIIPTSQANTALRIGNHSRRIPRTGKTVATLFGSDRPSNAAVGCFEYVFALRDDLWTQPSRFANSFESQAGEQSEFRRELQ